MDDLSAPLDPGSDDGARRHLVGVAYRLLGSVAEAEDAVQDAYSRWYALPPTARADIVNPTAWLTTVVGRICLDVLKSARLRRESYVGPWLPEPFAGDAVLAGGATRRDATEDPLDRVSLDESVSMAVLTVLEQLTPAQRVSFVLHDVFGYSFAELAHVTGRSAGACRELASQARRRIRAGDRATVTRGDLARSVAAFKVAWETGDVGLLVAQLTSVAVATVDGGGQVSAALRPVRGAEGVARFFLGVLDRQPDLVVREAAVNDAPGLVAVDGRGTVLATVSFALDGARIGRLWVVRNPAKLTSWSATSRSQA